jgi:hypothetical protein
MRSLDKTEQAKVDEWLRHGRNGTGLVGKVINQNCVCLTGRLMSTNARGIAEVAGVRCIVFVCSNCGRLTFFEAEKIGL